MLSGVALATMAVLAVGYVAYGRFIAAQYHLDDQRRTPAVVFNDGVDYVPTPRFYLLGQHFSAIAAAGPIAGPILACMQFGWLPCLLWIGLGVIFIGAVHDFSSLIASVRHNGQSIAEIVRSTLGDRAWLAIMIFIWIALIYVIIAFADITASTFVSGGEDLAGSNFTFHPGGAVAAASVLYLLLALLMGGLTERFRPALWLMTIIFVPATLAVVWLGTELSTWLILDGRTWAMLILGYCFVASLMPVWMLLQPRGYLGGFVLYLALLVGMIGICFGGFPIEQPAFKGWTAPGATGSLWPFLFVTIACGACSGFHGLVCSGTTSKQIARESDCRSIGYGAMLLEGLVALIALATVMIVSSDGLAGKAPGTVYGEGLGRFLTFLIGPEHLAFATTFGAMAFSTFVFDTLDVSTRLGRYILQELFGWRTKAGAVAATAITILTPAVSMSLADEGSYRLFWTLFGTSNQLLAALTLLAISVWLRRGGRRYWYTLIPMIFVMVVTLWSLAIQIGTAFRRVAETGVFGATGVNGVVCLLLMALAVFLVVESRKQFRVA
ncbi:MAG TPA: carbon starvation CstA family protein [Terriglobales bacterium]|nr:carbon starvation CstA family protein [Terriglobales bacterium]